MEVDPLWVHSPRAERPGQAEPPPVVVVVVVNHQTAPRTRVNWTKIPAGIAVNFSFVVVNPTAGGRNRKKPDQDLQNF